MNTPNKSLLLFWENDGDFIKMFSLFLREHGYYLNSVKSFDECVEFCRSRPPTLLIMQSFINEPRDGLEFLRKIRRDSSIAYFPILVGWADVISENAEQGYRQAFEAGANACFGRVFDITDVLEEIELLLKAPMTINVMDRQTIRMQKKSKDQ